MRRKRRKPSNKQGLQYLCFFYICTRQAYPFKFFLKRTVQKGKKKKKITDKKPIVQFCPSVFNAAGFLIMSERRGGRWWSGGEEEEVGGLQKQTKMKHTGRQIGCVLALEIILNISCRIDGTFLCNIFIIHGNSYCTSVG